MQEALIHMEGKRVVLTRGVHQTLTEFRWIAEDLIKRLTIIYELVSIQPTPDGYHDASGYMCGGAVFPEPMEVPWTPQPQPSAADISPKPTGVRLIV